MISNIITIGCKVEIRIVQEARREAENPAAHNFYSTKVADIDRDNSVIYVTAPIEAGLPKYLQANIRYDFIFITEYGLYRAEGQCIGRKKEGEILLNAIALTTNTAKFQRREYYRLSCALEMSARPLEKEEKEAMDANADIFLVPGLPLKRSVVVDISGGGIRFISSFKYEPDSLVYCKYNLIIDGVSKEYTLICKVLQNNELDNRPGVFEHRAQYVDIDTYEREEIIRFIFEEERKHRKREKGL